jgi:homoserine kinase
MSGKTVTVIAPATVANVGLGFDFMGFALQGTGDRVTLSLPGDGAETSIGLSGRYGDLIPDDPLKNTAGVATSAYLIYMGHPETKLKIEIEKNLPIGSGLGSSASSAAAALYALNILMDSPLTTEQLIPFGMEGERAACGTAHADNIAPSLLGGFVIIRSYDPLDIIRLQCPADLYCTVIHPHLEVRTSDARRILRRDIPLGDVTKQCANVAAFIAGIIRGDYNLIGRSMHDILVEPKRIQLIPGFENARMSALEAGAIGCGISGSGPSVFALCRGDMISERVAGAMKKSLSGVGLDSDSFISPLNAPGACMV